MRIETPFPAEIEILRQRGISKSILERACLVAHQSSMPPAEYLVARGYVDEEAIYSAFAEACGLTFLPARSFRSQSVNSASICLGKEDRGPVLIGLTDQEAIYAIAPSFGCFPKILNLCRHYPSLSRKVRITTPAALMQSTRDLVGPEGDLETRFPGYSARSRLEPGQMTVAACLLFGFLFGGFVSVLSGLVACAIVVSLACILMGVMRFTAAFASLGTVTDMVLPLELSLSPIRWPSYTVLVPLYREKESAVSLIRHLSRLDYPREKLQVLFLLERDDHETFKHLRPHLSGSMSVHWVPNGAPRTKPRALAHGLEQAKGTLLTIFDAEDRPDPDQLKLAAFFFALGPKNLACLQARLAIDNASDNFLTRHFAFEYACLFDQMLPWLHRKGWPIPLGGTSNHFRTEALMAVGGWDKYNVTEDADLGIRLARMGYATGVLPSTTWEEAPVSWRAWRNQRARWHKGWIQTFFVHTRRLRQSFRDLGPTRLAVFLAMIAGNMLILSISPMFMLLLGLYTSGLLAVPQLEGAGQTAFVVSCVSATIICYGGSVMALLRAGRQRDYGNALGAALTLPVYWLANALAFYQAVWEFCRSPHAWNKTAHGVSKTRRTPGDAASTSKKSWKFWSG